MWKSIKKFFKWIADHTGISWITRKISSGWNSTKNWWSGNKANQASGAKKRTGSMKHALEPIVSDVIYEKDDKLVLALSIDTAQSIFGCNHLESMEEYYVNIKSDRGEFRIAGSKLPGIDDQSCSFLFSINKVANQDTTFDNIEKMKEILGLNDATKEVKINDIRESSYVFMPTVNKATNLEAEQHAAGDVRSVN